MAFADYFQAPKCPACNSKIQNPKKSLAPQKVFSGHPVSAGQCPGCKTDMQWVRSWEKALIMSVVGAIVCALTFSLIGMMRGEDLLAKSQVLAQIFGISIAIGFVSSKILSVTKPPASGK